MSSTSVTPIGLAALATLVGQNTALVLFMRHAVTNGSGFLASTAVCCDEVMKLVLCIVVMAGYYMFKVPATYMQPLPMDSGTPTKSAAGLYRFLKRELFGQAPLDILKMSVPALCYTVQKNCLFLALRHLEAAVYMVSYQAKILTTALFSCTLLGRAMSKMQVLALCLLAMGIAIIQVDELTEKATRRPDIVQNPLLGLAAVCIACMTSGFAGVFFELQLKTPSYTHSSCDHELAAEFSMWVRNFHLALFALITALIGTYYKDGDIIAQRGFLQGYTLETWVVIVLEAFGGIVVALVIKFTDNILKTFATALSIVTATAVSSLMMKFSVTPVFSVGTLLVLGAVMLYQRNPPSKDNTCPIGRCKFGRAIRKQQIDT